MKNLEDATPPTRRAVALLVLLLVASVPWGPIPQHAAASHSEPQFCDPYDNWTTLIELVTPDGESGLYIHDRHGPRDDCLILPCWPYSEGTWIFMENGLESGLQTGGDAIVPIMNETGSDDPCPEQPTSDDVIF